MSNHEFDGMPLRLNLPEEPPTPPALPDSAVLHSATPAAVDLQPHHACADCRQVWGENWMDRVGEQWLCRPCHEQRKELAQRAKNDPHGYRNLWRTPILAYPLSLAAALGLALGGMRIWMMNKLSGDMKIESPEPWSGKPFEKWPRLVLTNETRLRGSDSTVKGGTAFLIESESGPIFGATSGRLLTASESDASAPLHKFQQALIEWRMYPANAPDKGVNFSELQNDLGAPAGAGALFFRTKLSAKQLPATPLKVRQTLLTPGMKVRVVASAEAGNGQRLLEGRVLPVPGALLAIQLEQPDLCKGLCGAPVVDMRGHVVGAVSEPADEPGEDGRFRALAFQPIEDPEPKTKNSGK